MKRRRVLNILARMLTAWILLVVQGVCDSTSFAALAFAPPAAPLACAAPASSQEEQEAQHAKLCHCRMCRGPKHCCCDTTSKGGDGAAYRASCDTPQDTALPGTVGPVRALPPTLTVVACGWHVTLPVQRLETSDTFRARRPEPVTPPPSA